MKSTPLTCAAVLLLTLSLSDSADAIRCRQWDRLGPAQKEATIQGLIDGLARNNSVRQTNVNLVTVTRCLCFAYTDSVDTWRSSSHWRS